MFAKVLVANRGEIAVRVLRSLKEMGIRTAAVYSEADRTCRHVDLADEAVLIGPGPAAKSYLSTAALLDAARRVGADAIHPGYGFLSENADFAEACELAGLTFIGPAPESLRLAGNKLGARRALEEAGVPVIPGSLALDGGELSAERVASSLGYPLMLKAAAGGGGRGIRHLSDARDLREEFLVAAGEARAAFGDGTLYLEKQIPEARHVEVQILGDGRGNVVHLGERNCSVQRRHQKMIEEAPSPGLERAQAERLWEAALIAARALRYRNAGTVEFLLDRDGGFYFMEVNARIQVEHPVTEAVTGVDIVKTQVQTAAEGRLPFSQADVSFTGHAIECRINAEDPDRGFMPQPGTIAHFAAPQGEGVRVDTHVYSGYTVPIYYDSLLAKLIARAPSRHEALGVMARALSELQIGPIATTAPFLRRVLDTPEFQSGRYTTALVSTLVSEEPNELGDYDEPGDSAE